MARTRSSILRAASHLAADVGTRRASMSEIAAAAGVAKGTLYNHFRTRDEIWPALVRAEQDALIDECRGLPLELALSHAAHRVGAHPAVRRIVADEPETLTAILTSDMTPARDAVAALLSAAQRDPAGADLVLRWLASHLATPAIDPGAAAALLASVLPGASGHATRGGLPH
jgi:AcrR family transcriptional regulator